MKHHRRQFLQIAAGAVLLPQQMGVAAALDPSRPIRIIVGTPAGLAPDVSARLVGSALSERLGQPVVVENRPGAGGVTAAQAVGGAPADGNTLLLVVSGYAASAALYPRLEFNFSQAIAPIAFIGNTPYVMSVHPSVPAKTVPEFLAYAKANPGKINMASPGIGTAPHLAGELLKMMTGVDLVHVPYRESYIPDLLSGRVQVSFPAIAQVLNHVREGSLLALSVTHPKRLGILPNVPAMDEFVPGYDGSGWLGVGCPSGTPVEVVEIFNKAISAIIADPAIRARFVSLGIEPEPMTPLQFGQLFTAATDKWAKVVKFAGIKTE